MSFDSMFGRRNVPVDPPAIQRIKRHELHGQAMLSLHDAKKFIRSICDTEQAERYLNDNTPIEVDEWDQIVIRDPLNIRKTEAEQFANDFWSRAEEAKKQKPATGFDQEAFEKEVEEEVRAEMNRDKVKESLQYHADLAEHTCDSPHPIGACLKCDLDKVLEL